MVAAAIAAVVAAAASTQSSHRTREPASRATLLNFLLTLPYFVYQPETQDLTWFKVLTS
jgi:hypothetical protein